MRILAAAAAVAALVAPPGPSAAQNRQLISVSLLECGEIFSALVDGARAHGGRKQAEIDDAERTALRFTDAALREAQREGQSDAWAFLVEARAALREKWEGRFASLRLLRDNLDWIDYCRAVGRDRGVLPLPE